MLEVPLHTSRWIHEASYLTAAGKVKAPSARKPKYSRTVTPTITRMRAVNNACEIRV